MRRRRWRRAIRVCGRNIRLTAWGGWLKAANIREIQRLNPHATGIRTQNADSNGAMLKINSALGVRPFMASTVWRANVTRVLDSPERATARP